MDDPLPPEINIITLNCWGLKFNISKLRQQRLHEIGRQLSQTHPAPHIVCLQEVWSHDDYLAIRRSLRARLPHGKFYYSGAFGAGLAILSHWPIEESTMSPYTLNGRPTAFWRGDWYVGKGIAQARIRFGLGPDDIVAVFNTHTHAPYASDADDSYRVHREAQSWQLAKLLRAAAERGNLVVAAGDFNMTPLSTEHRILTAHAPVQDVWRVLHPDSSLGAVSDPVERSRRRPTPSAEHNLTENGATSNSIYNTWRWPRAAQSRLGPGKPLQQIPPDTPDPHGKRLDYIFTSTAARETDDQGTVGGWVVRHARVGMIQRHPELGCSLSDHFSVEATLAFHTTTSMTTTRPEGLDDNTMTAPSLTGWPLPPGRLSMLNAFRRNTPQPEQPVDGGATNAEEDEDDNDNGDDDGGGGVNRAVGGTFLSLQSPTPSTSRRSHSLPPNSHATTTNLPPDYDTQLLNSIIPQPAAAAAAHTNNAAAANFLLFSSADYSALLSEIKLYQAREGDQVRLRTAHFCFWVFALVACCLAVWFIPTHSDRLSVAQNHGVNFVLVLLSSLGLVAGCIDGLMALLFFEGSEKRALREFEWEVRNAKRIVQGEVGAVAEEFDVGNYK